MTIPSVVVRILISKDMQNYLTTSGGMACTKWTRKAGRWKASVATQGSGPNSALWLGWPPRWHWCAVWIGGRSWQKRRIRWLWWWRLAWRTPGFPWDTEKLETALCENYSDLESLHKVFVPVVESDAYFKSRRLLICDRGVVDDIETVAFLVGGARNLESCVTVDFGHGLIGGLFHLVLVVKTQRKLELPGADYDSAVEDRLQFHQEELVCVRKVFYLGFESLGFLEVPEVAKFFRFRRGGLAFVPWNVYEWLAA